MLKFFFIWLSSNKKRLYIYVPLAVTSIILLGLLWILIPFVLSVIASIVLWKSSFLGKGWKTALAATMILVGLTVSGAITPKTTIQQLSESGAPAANNQNFATQNSSVEQPPLSPQEQSDTRVLDSVSRQHDVTLTNIKTALESYKLPVKSGQWQTCVIERINGLSNLQLLTFYDGFKSLSPHASEENGIIWAARRLGCPEPSFKTIPAKTETLYSKSGIGSKELGTVSINDAIEKKDWFLILLWSNNPLNENFGAGTGADGEEIAFRQASWDYGIVNYNETSSIVGTPYLIGFYSPSGSNQEYGEQLLGGNIIRPNRFEYLRVKAPDQASWEVKIERVLEPAKTVIE